MGILHKIDKQDLETGPIVENWSWNFLKTSAFIYDFASASIWWKYVVKFIYSEKATKFSKISTVDLFYVVTVRSTVEISQNFVAFSEYMNFNWEKVRENPDA